MLVNSDEMRFRGTGWKYKGTRRAGGASSSLVHFILQNQKRRREAKALWNSISNDF